LNFRSPAVLTAIGAIATLVLAVAVVMVLLRTGGAKAVSDNAGLIGALVALGGVFTTQLVSIALEDRRTREAALQNYFERVGKLLTEKSLYNDGPDRNLVAVVRAQTLAVLEGLDPHRKRILLQFLYESGLIHKDKTVVSLAAANLGRADLSGADLSGADLSGADLRGADLSRASLSKADLRTADLRTADMSEATLYKADLSRAVLTGTTLSKAKLSNVDLSKAFLIGTDLIEAILSGADLRGADLSRANLSRVRMRKAILSATNLSGTNLSHADLSRTNLSGAKGLNNEQLEQRAASLKGATMPDGSKHP
jgi:uncharacterized protein YjbI with pentapeptide repeats